MTQIIDLDAVAMWPPDLLAYLDKHHDLFLGWEQRRVSGAAYDKALYGLRDVLAPYAITGWHCTRLTDEEIATILASGMGLPDASMLSRRIDAVVGTGLMTEAVASQLKAKNQAHEQYRAGMLWFCFFPPRVAGKGGIIRFFRCWGGEALYNSHEGDPATAAVLGSIGVPCLVEADVPIAGLEPDGGLDFNIVRRFLISRGYKTVEPVDHENRIKRPLPAENIRRIIRFPERDFLKLTGCDSWKTPLKHG